MAPSDAALRTPNPVLPHPLRPARLDLLAAPQQLDEQLRGKRASDASRASSFSRRASECAVTAIRDGEGREGKDKATVVERRLARGVAHLAPGFR